MKILTEKEQLKKKADELWDICHFQENELRLKEKQVRRAENRLFKNNGTIRVLKYELEKIRAVLFALEEFRTDVHNALQALSVPAP